MKEHMKMRTVAENIKKYRLKKGWTQEELAERAEVSHAFVNQIENCKRDMTLGYCYQICNALNVTPNDLLMVDQKPDASKEQIERFQRLICEMEDQQIHFLLDTMESMKKPIEQWMHSKNR